MLLARVRLLITERGLHFRGILRRVDVASEDVTRVQVRPNRGNVDVWSRNAHLQFCDHYDDLPRLRRCILDAVGRHAPHAVLVFKDAPWPFRTRSRQEGRGR
jgi:hypothetical protein